MSCRHGPKSDGAVGIRSVTFGRNGCAQAHCRNLLADTWLSADPKRQSTAVKLSYICRSCKSSAPSSLSQKSHKHH